MALGIRLLLALILCSDLALAAEATFSWLPNTDSFTTGYVIHIQPRHDTEQTTDVGNPDPAPDGRIYATATVPDSGIWFAWATAYDADGTQSERSDVLTLVERHATGSAPMLK